MFGRDQLRNAEEVQIESDGLGSITLCPKRTVLTLVIVVQVALWGVILCDVNGLHIPLIRQLIGFLYITFVPGVLVVRLLRIGPLSAVQELIYSISISLSLVMVVGFLCNLLLPLFGVMHPISLTVLTLGISLLVILLTLALYLSEGSTTALYNHVSLNTYRSPAVGMLCVLPLLSIIGTFYVNQCDDNTVLLIMISLISVVFVFIIFSDALHQDLYPIAIWLITISLIWHKTLITPYILTYDVGGEMYVANQIISAGVWDISKIYYINYSELLSVTILPAIYSLVLNLNLTWIYKLVFPCLLSFIPVGIYGLFNPVIGKKKAFSASFLFVSLNSFYGDISFIPKQIVAELFFVFLLFLLFSDDFSRGLKYRFVALFALTLVVTHYGTTYLVFSACIFVFILSKVTYYVRAYIENHSILSNFHMSNLRIKSCISCSGMPMLFLLLFFIFIYMWYAIASDLFAFDQVVAFGKHFSYSIFQELFDPEASRGMAMLSRDQMSPLHMLYKYFSILVVVISGVGVLVYLLSRKKINQNIIFIAIYWLGILSLSVALSGFAVMNPYRLHHLAFIVLSPFAIIGGEAILTFALGLVRTVQGTGSKGQLTLSDDLSLKLMSIFILMCYLLNTGFVFEILADHPDSFSISQEKILGSDDVNTKGRLLLHLITTYDICSSYWLSAMRDTRYPIYSNTGYGQGAVVFLGYSSIPANQIHNIAPTNNSIDYSHIHDGYIYRHYYTVFGNISAGMDSAASRLVYSTIATTPQLEKMKVKVYTNGGSDIFLT